MVGMPLIPKRPARAPCSSTLTLPTFADPTVPSAISSITGPIMRQGPHQGAQKSRRTGVGDLSTSASKLDSVIVTTFWLAIVVIWKVIRMPQLTSCAHVLKICGAVGEPDEAK